MRKVIIAISNDHFTSSPAGWNAQIAAIGGQRGERPNSPKPPFAKDANDANVT